MKKRNTKIALASLMAVSAIVPAVAASAEVGGDITRSGETAPSSDIVNFTIDNERVAPYLPTSGKLTTRDGQSYISLDIKSEDLELFKDITVEGKSIITVVPNVGTFVAVPINANLDPVKLNVTMITPMGDREVEVTLTPEKSADSESEPSTPKPPTTVEPVVKPAALKYLAYYNIPDGEYEVTFDAYNPETNDGNYTPITNQLNKEAKLVVENGKYFLEVSEIERKNEEGEIDTWIKEYQVLVDGEYVKAETVKGSLEEYPHVVRLPLTSLNDLTTAKLNVVVPSYNMNHWYNFKIAIDKGQDLPQLYPTYVYQDGTNEKSIMQDTYLTSTSKVEITEDGKYEIELTFPVGQVMTEFVFNGQVATVADTYEETTDKGQVNTVKVYTVTVDDISKIYNATFDLNVPGFYQAKHSAQIQFGGKANPFADAVKSYAYSNIVSLYNKGIFVEGAKFNPTNKLPRAHFALMMAKAFELEVPETTKFTDIGSQNEAIQNAIKALNNYGIISGSSDTTFNPNGTIKRYEAALMIDKMLEKQGIVANEGLTSSFTDLSSMNARSKAAIEHLSSLDIIKGKGNGKFDPTGELTRQDMAIILDKTLKLIEKQ